MRTRLVRCAAILVTLTACGDSPSEPGAGTFPTALSGLGVDGPGSHSYEPAWPLWTNGAEKVRIVRLPDGATIDALNRHAWAFPDGALFTKTFTYRTNESPDVPVPVETRVILRVDGGWETAIYRWREDGSDADLLPGDSRVSVPIIRADGSSLTHVIPSRVDCETCHAPRPSFILGFSELQLNHHQAGASATQLEHFAEQGFFDQPLPGAPGSIEAPDEGTRQVLGYVHGNCTHCHHQGYVAARVDLSHETFLRNTVGQPATGGQTLVVPGDPDASYLFEQLATGRMPPLGVQVLDNEALEGLRDWILQLDPGS